jgi:hypothetical protein
MVFRTFYLLEHFSVFSLGPKRGPPKAYVVTLEERVHRMETLLAQLGNHDSARGSLDSAKVDSQVRIQLTFDFRI